MRFLLFAGMIALAAAPSVGIAKLYLLLYHRGTVPNTMKAFGQVAPVWLRASLAGVAIATFLGLWAGMLALSDRLRS